MVGQWDGFEEPSRSAQVIFIIPKASVSPPNSTDFSVTDTVSVWASIQLSRHGYSLKKESVSHQFTLKAA